MVQITAGAGRTLYYKGFEGTVLGNKQISLKVNPLFADRNVLNEAATFNNTTKTNPWGAVYDLFDKIKIGGKYGIIYDTSSERPSGCFNASEILYQKRGCCLEQTFLFLSIAVNGGFNYKQTDVIGFVIYRLEDNSFDIHACPGIIIRPALRGEYAKISHYRFSTDSQFRSEVLNIANLPDTNDVSLVLLDLTYPKIGAQHRHIVPLGNEGLVSAYLTNSGTNFYDRKNVAEAVRRWEYALQINDKELLALSNLIKHAHENNNWEKVMLLTEDYSRIINVTDLVRRTEASAKEESLDIAPIFSALASDPKCIDAYNFLIGIYTRTGEIEDALSLLSSLRRKLDIAINEAYMQLVLQTERTNKVVDNLSSRVNGLRQYRLLCEQTLQKITTEAK